MRNQTESTNISVQQLPIKSVKDWARTMIRDGKAPELLLLIKLIPRLNQLRQESILFEFLDMDEQVMVELMSEGNDSAEKIEEINGVRDRQELWKALSNSEVQFERLIRKLRPSNKPELNINVAAYHLGEITLEYHGKFVAYLEKTHANRSQIASFKNLRHFSINTVNRLAYYLEQVTEAIGITTIKETMKAMERARSASQQPRPAEKKRQNQGKAHNPYQIAAEPSASKILWRNTSTQKRK